MSITIFTLTHKQFTPPSDPMYRVLQVGAQGKQGLGYLRDDTGDNISALNCYYSELTGLYWIWKNYHEDDYIGTCHYRRYLLGDSGRTMSAGEYEEAMREYDLITTKRVLLNNSYRCGFMANHNVKVLDVTGEVIRDMYPEYHDNFVRLVNGPETYFGNMFVMSHRLFDEYCEWLFSIFAEVGRRTSLENGEDAYHKRVFGFVSEFLLLVFAVTRRLRVKECRVAMTEEKAETREAKAILADFFRKKDVQGAKEYILGAIEKRPDLLMEASDITGELRLSMQIISTCEFELAEYGSCVLDREHEFDALIKMFEKINRQAVLYKGDMKKIMECGASSAAAEIAQKLMNCARE